MTLLLHCGYHKTASSYFQACFVHGNKLLLKNGIYHPADPLNEKVLSGKPTAGNGDPLCQALLKQDKEKSRKLLLRYFKEAQESGAKSVLLSTEGYFTCFTSRAIVDLFMELVKAVGFQSTRALIFFRDPVDHAISVYCHRAPSGKLPAFSDWLEKNFETPSRMDAFATHFDIMPIEWQIRKFQPKVKDIAEVCFADWLQLPEAKELAARTSEVNVSVSISESELIRECQHSFPGSGRYVGRSLKEVDRKLKPGEPALRKSYEHQAARYFQRHQGVIENINRLLPRDEQLFFPALSGVAEESAPLPVFSSAQVVACAQGVLAYKRSRTAGGRFRRYLNRTGQQLKELFSPG